tara:strand:- start:222 stop:344 length:123 start_codon:yes stop_codon:yes gene_type:complete
MKPKKIDKEGGHRGHAHRSTKILYRKQANNQVASKLKEAD